MLRRAHHLRGKRIVAVVTGSTIDPEVLDSIINQGLT
jgi:hypothetical protein